MIPEHDLLEKQYFKTIIRQKVKHIINFLRRKKKRKGRVP